MRSRDRMGDPVMAAAFLLSAWVLQACGSTAQMPPLRPEESAPVLSMGAKGHRPWNRAKTPPRPNALLDATEPQRGK